ncbi:EXS-domain-containing protein [Daldinia caldariorum]|uniref:EXS-domain-containing protein n=1 Tax=Daldinia caldariorum TaxID=326644 RepID=UPI002007F9BA|nr:EXS-domain-containing protein [Daldinia caldariorum]KAI1470022.1 EXS-domain-containing protein [Daldinia caldariorum]
MDFSFFQPDTRHRFLRDILGFKRRWLYYVIMVIDPILRFGWIFYAIFTHNKQHSTIVSFLVALAEVTRRGMWALFRVENEHCGNVAQYKASRDVPLPYPLPPHEPLIERPSSEEEDQNRIAKTATRLEQGPMLVTDEAAASAIDLGTIGAAAIGREQTKAQGQKPAQEQTQAEGSGIRWRRRSEVLRARSIRGIMADAHRQDFEKRRRPLETASLHESGGLAEEEGGMQSEEDDDDEDDTGSMLNERMEARRAEGLVKPESSEESV